MKVDRQRPSWLRRRFGRIAGFVATFLAAPGLGVAEATTKRLLFVIGGSNTAGFLEGSNPDDRDEQRAEIGNFSNTSGNHGWGELAGELEAAGYELVQMEEDAGTMSGDLNVGAPLPFDEMDLGRFAAIVMGSNNASYTANQIDALESYVRDGGGVVFISDANFGGSWEGNANTGWQDASNSDQQFLDRFGLAMNQDRGTYSGRRGSGHFLVPDHPLVANGVDEIHGEGVTPVSLGTPVAGVHSRIIVRVPSDQDVGKNVPPFNNAGRGGSRDSTADDGVVAIALAGGGRVVGHFDRNTFFNDGGAGSDITRFDNRQYALNLFAWLSAGADLPAPANGWESWQRRYFNELDRLNAAVSGPNADPDDDGLPNWREALHGLDPHAADDADEPLSLFADIAGNQVRWRFRRGGDWDAASLNITRSTDLDEWTTLVPDEEVVIDEVPGGEWVEYRLDSAGGREFWRFEFDDAAIAP
jgi:hypothetical protein